MKLLIIQSNLDSVIDVELMVVPDDYDKEYAIQWSSLREPYIVHALELDDYDHKELINLGEYRPFIG